MNGRKLLTLLLLSLALGCESHPGPADDDDDTVESPSYESLPAELAAAFDAERQQLGAPGLAVAIRHGDTLYAQGFGTRRPDGGAAVEPETLFRIGSITKMLTAPALLQQVEAGRASLDDVVTDHVPGVQLQGNGSTDELTLHQLLSHQGGISDHTPLTGGTDDERLFGYSVGSLASNAYFMSPPGSFWNYSNPNYALAGLVAQEADGRLYRDLLRQDVLEPLGMDRTWFLAEDVEDDSNFAVGLTRDWEGSGEERYAEPASYGDAWSRPAGFAWSSVLQLVTFADFLLQGDEAVLSDTLREQMTSPQVDTQAFLDRVHYGYGLMFFRGMADGSDWYEVETMEHGGAIPGFSAQLTTVPAYDLVMATLTSTDNATPAGALAQAARSFAELTSGSRPDPEIAADLSVYEGTWNDPYNVGEIVVSLDGAGLRVDMPLLDQLDIPYEHPFTPVSRDNFAITVQGFNMQIALLNPQPGGGYRWFRCRYFVGEWDDGSKAWKGQPDPQRLVQSLVR